MFLFRRNKAHSRMWLLVIMNIQTIFLREAQSPIFEMILKEHTNEKYLYFCHDHYISAFKPKGSR